MDKLKKLSKARLFMPLTCLALVLLVNLVVTPSFFEIELRNGVFYGYIVDIINRSSELVILAVGMMLVVAVSGGTDISVGATLALSGAVSVFILTGGQNSVNEYHAPYILGLLGGVLTGMLCGMWNGFLVAKMRIQPMVATLILFTAGRGIAQVLTGGFILYQRYEPFKYLGNNIPGSPLPTPVFVAVAVVLLTVLVLNKTSLRLFIESVGVNRKAARLVGIRSVRMQFLCYTFCGICAGIAGLIATSRVYSIDANNAGLNIELDAILAVAIGGNSLGGGKFSLLGSIIGAVTIQALTTSLYAMSVTADQLPVYKAIVVVIIVSLQSPGLKKFLATRKKRGETHA